jgi:phosphopantothenate synthetase
MNEEPTISHEIEEFKTNSDELDNVLDRYDLDESLEAEFNAIDERFKQLEITYKSLLNTRRFLHNG